MINIRINENNLYSFYLQMRFKRHFNEIEFPNCRISTRRYSKVVSESRSYAGLQYLPFAGCDLIFLYALRARRKKPQSSFKLQETK